MSLISQGWFKPIRWNRFIRDFAVIQVGFALFGLSITMLIQANLGTSPWVTLSVSLSQLSGLSVGTITMLIGLAVLLLVLATREPIGWGTLGNILSIGPWVDLWLRTVPSIQDNLLLQLLMLAGSALVMGFASAIYIGVDAGAGPRDSLMLTAQRVSGWSLRVSRAAIEIAVLTTGWLLGGPVGIGTLIFAMLIGPSVQWAFRLLKVTRSPKP
jgi:uncharacterized membrane protein YczE